MRFENTCALFALALAPALGACGGGSSEADAKEGADAQETGAAGTAGTAGTGAAAEPAPAPGPAGSTPGPAGPSAAWDGRPAFEAQEGWVEETPSGSMRKAQYRLPVAGGDDLEVVVFNFPGGGTVDQNLDRWVGQFSHPDVPSGGKVLTRAGRTTPGGVGLHQLDVVGSYTPAAFAGGGGGPQAGYRMLGSILETPTGFYFVTLRGPEAEVEAWKASFDRFVETSVP